MAKYNLNLTSNYCDHWGIWEAIREILQNGEDQQTIDPTNEVSISYDKNKKLLTVSNKNSVLLRKSLLLGGTSKRDDEKTIGSFGEGYKIALLIFKKLGINPIIKNYAKNERWTTEFNEDSMYENEKVLKVIVKKHIFKKLPDHNLSFEMHGVSEEDWNLVNENYLKLHSEYKTFTANNGDQLLLDEKYKGLVYINGLFVEKLKGKYEFGYNLTPKSMKLDRDRQSVKGWNFEFISGALLKELMKDCEQNDNKNRVIKAIKDKASETQSNAFKFTSSKEITERLKEDLIKDYGENAFPVSTQSDSDYIKKRTLNVQPVIVSDIEKSFLENDKDFSSMSDFITSKKDNNDNKLLTPTDELEMFLMAHSKNMSYQMEKEMKELLKKSSNWKNINEETNVEEPEVLNIGSDSESLVVDLKDEEVEEVEEIEEINKEVVFDDLDIPF